MQNSVISIYPASPSQTDRHAWVALDMPEEWESFSALQTNQQATAVENAQPAWCSSLVVEGIRCAACALNIEDALKGIPGVVAVSVNASSHRAQVVWQSNKTKPSVWMDAAAKAGYRLLPAADVSALEMRRKESRKALWRWLVAGFCMMQVMMYAMPNYVAGPGEMSADMSQLLRWASWVLTLPIMLFSCGPFLRSAWGDIQHRRISMDLPVAIGILMTFLVSTAATFEPSGWWGHEVYFDSMSMFVFFLLTGRWLELKMRDKTAGALEALMQRLPASIERQAKEGSFERVAVRRLKVGDVIRVYPGEAFPADGVLMVGQTNVDEALLTGESRAVPKAKGEAVISGSYNLSAVVQVQVEKVGLATRYAEIVRLIEQAASQKPRLAQMADRIAKPFLVGVLLASALAAAMLWQAGAGHALMAAVAVLIVTCPCALSLATPAAMLTVSGALAKKGVLVRRMQALETLANIDTVVFDKTGTLTADRMTLLEVKTNPTLNKVEALQIAAAMAQHSLHPLSKALVNACDAKTLAEVWKVEEISGFGLKAESALGQLKLGSAKFCGLDFKADDHSKVYLIDQDGWLASFVIEEAVRGDALQTVDALQAQDLSVQILSGDQQLAVDAVALALGVTEVYANSTPHSKLAHIKFLQQQGRRVLMVGDGLNDGPVLAAADVSIAIGQAMPLAQAQSDFVILGAQLALVPELLAEAIRTLKIVKQNLIWAACYNAIGVPLAIVGWLPAWLAGLGMAASSLLVILNAARLAKSVKPSVQSLDSSTSLRST